VWREHANKVTKEQEQNAYVKQVASQAQLARFEQLRRVALPGVLVSVEPNQTTQQKDGKAYVGIQAKQEIVECVHSDTPW
jgi:hypothetical protein